MLYELRTQSHDCFQKVPPAILQALKVKGVGIKGLVMKGVGIKRVRE
jgi:hypothetical protein